MVHARRHKRRRGSIPKRDHFEVERGEALVLRKPRRKRRRALGPDLVAAPPTRMPRAAEVECGEARVLLKPRRKRRRSSVPDLAAAEVERGEALVLRKPRRKRRRALGPPC